LPALLPGGSLAHKFDAFGQPLLIASLRFALFPRLSDFSDGALSAGAA
jgi:hypothetical protein